MEHARENGMSADLEPMQCDVILTRKKQSRDADNRRKHTYDKGASMHDAFMPIGIRITLTDSPSVSGHFTPCWACRSVCRDTNSLVVNEPNLFTFNLYENSLLRFTLRK